MFRWKLQYANQLKKVLNPSVFNEDMDTVGIAGSRFITHIIVTTKQNLWEVYIILMGDAMARRMNQQCDRQTPTCLREIRRIACSSFWQRLGSWIRVYFCLFRFRRRLRWFRGLWAAPPHRRLVRNRPWLALASNDPLRPEFQPWRMKMIQGDC